MESQFDQFMAIALEEARESLREGNNGFGAVVVKDGTVIAQAHDREETEGDPTSHAEMNAIRMASRQLGKNLGGCLVASAHEPCPMCAAAIAWARIRELAYGYSIAEALGEGRVRINLSCGEVFERAGISVTLHTGVLHDKCSTLYRRDVREQVSMLRGATTADLERLAGRLTEKRLCWWEANRGNLTIESGRGPAAGYDLLMRKLGVDPADAPIAEQTSARIVFHSRNFCPTLEACEILGLDTRRVCRLMTEKPADALIKQLDGRLTFTRNYERLRPYAEYCEEIVEVRE